MERPRYAWFTGLILLFYLGLRPTFSLALREDGGLAHTAKSREVYVGKCWLAHLVPCSSEEAGLQKPISVRSKAVAHSWKQGMKNLF